MPLLRPAAGQRAPAAVPAPTPAVWDQVDIVPMPKRIALTGRRAPLSAGRGAALVVGERPCRQAEIGADWINRRMRALGKPALGVAPRTSAPAGALRIVIGTRDDNALIRHAAEARRIDVAPGNPGERGYGDLVDQ